MVHQNETRLWRVFCFGAPIRDSSLKTVHRTVFFTLGLMAHAERRAHPPTCFLFWCTYRDSSLKTVRRHVGTNLCTPCFPSKNLCALRLFLLCPKKHALFGDHGYTLGLMVHGKEGAHSACFFCFPRELSLKEKERKAPPLLSKMTVEKYFQRCYNK